MGPTQMKVLAGILLQDREPRDRNQKHQAERKIMNTFKYETHQLKPIEKDGEIWFVAKEVCRILGLTYISQAVSSLDEEDKGLYKVHTNKGDREHLIINESGMYSLIMKSNKPEARKFKKWVTSEVLPAIRKTGSYATPNEKPSLVQRAEMFLEAVRRTEELDGRVTQLEDLVEVGSDYCTMTGFAAKRGMKLRTAEAAEIGVNRQSVLASPERDPLY
ncbi:MAG TPA: hypothetical protein EYQ81_05520 [Sneathiellales bacterium]|nr:hypothetical protein [Sneathiellales bacterium]